LSSKFVAVEPPSASRFWAVFLFSGEIIMTFETVQEKARREGRTVQGIYAALAAGRIAGARKIEGKWRIPLHAAQPAAPVRDFKLAQANDSEE
jgi:hypothetical protein